MSIWICIYNRYKTRLKKSSLSCFDLLRFPLRSNSRDLIRFAAQCHSTFKNLHKFYFLLLKISKTLKLLLKSWLRECATKNHGNTGMRERDGGEGWERGGRKRKKNFFLSFFQKKINVLDWQKKWNRRKKRSNKELRSSSLPLTPSPFPSVCVKTYIYKNRFLKVCLREILETYSFNFLSSPFFYPTSPPNGHFSYYYYYYC